MSITFNRAQLIKVTNDALKAHDRAAAERQKQVDKYKFQHKLTGIGTSHRHGRALRDHLTKALKGHEPITTVELRKVLGGTTSLGDRFYDPPRDYDINRELEDVPKGLLRPVEASEARTLLRVLSAAEGDTVSVNELKLLGLKNLEPVFAAAARASEGG